MMTARLLPLPLLAILWAATPVAAQEMACPQFFPGGQPPGLLNTRLATGAVLLCNDGYAVVASSVTRGGLWSAEHPTTQSLAAARATPRQGQFHPDARLRPGERAELEDFRGSSYDRGHLTPSGDLPDARSQQQSFSLANIVPQAAALNRGVWEGIERAVRHWAERTGELYVVTGPAFVGSQVSSIGPNGVLVPSATWKAVYDPRADGAGVYYCLNTDRPTCRAMTVKALAALTGIDPFPDISPEVKARLQPLPAPERNHYSEESSIRRQHPNNGPLDGLLNQLFDR